MNLLNARRLYQTSCCTAFSLDCPQHQAGGGGSVNFPRREDALISMSWLMWTDGCSGNRARRLRNAGRMDLLTANDRLGDLSGQLVRGERRAAAAVPGAGGQSRRRRLRDRRRLYRAFGGAAPGGSRLRRRAPRGAAGRLGRVGAQRRADGLRPAARPGLARAAARGRDGAGALGDGRGGQGAGPGPRRAAWHRLRPAAGGDPCRLPGGRGGGVPRRGGEARARLRLRRARAARPGRDRGASRHQGLSRRRARPRGGAPASAQLRARAGAGGRGGGRADLRGEPGRGDRGRARIRRCGPARGWCGPAS